MRSFHPPEFKTRFFLCSSTYFKEEFRSADLQLLSTPQTFCKYFSKHDADLALKYWQFLFEDCPSVLPGKVNCLILYLQFDQQLDQEKFCDSIGGYSVQYGFMGTDVKR
jgi:hypothetical protein